MFVGKMRYSLCALLLAGVCATPGLAYADGLAQGNLDAELSAAEPVIQASDANGAASLVESAEDHGLTQAVIASKNESASSVTVDDAEENSDSLTSPEVGKDEGAGAPDSVEHPSDGTYAIESAVADGKVIDAKDGSTANGTKVQSYESNGTDAQVWRLETSDGGVTTIYHAASGKALDVANGSAYEGAVVQLWESNGTNAQKWRLVRDGDFYKIVSLLDENLVLDLSGANKANGTPIQLWRDNGTLAQRWSASAAATARMRLDKLASDNRDLIEDGSYALRSDLLLTLVLDAKGGGTDDGTTVQTYTANDTYAQRWKVSRDSKGYLTFINVKSGKALDVANGEAFNGAAVQLYASNGTWAQKWIAVLRNGAYVLISGINESYALDVTSASKVNSTAIQLYKANGTAAQSWHFAKAGKEGVSFSISAENNSIVQISIGFGDYAVALPSYAAGDNVSLVFCQDVVLGSGAYAVSAGTAVTLLEAQVSTLETAAELDVADLQCSLLASLWFLKSSGVSAFFLTSDDPDSYGRNWVESSPSHTNSATGSVSVVAADGTLIYNGKSSQIKGRGNTSWNLDKKPYQVKLDKKADLVQTGASENKAKTWLLISDGYDSSALRNVIAYSYAQLLGVSKAIDFDIVDLYYNGEYRGTYLLCEKVQINKGRVDIEDLEGKNEDLNPTIDQANIVEGVNSYGVEVRYAQNVQNPSDISGGYLIEHEVDWGRYTSESAYFAVMVGGSTQHFVCKSPEVWSYEEADYISCLVQDIFDAAVNGGIVPTWRGSTRAGMKLDDLIDVDSLARIYWVDEILKNPDGYVWSSGYLFKDSDANGVSKVSFGPAWDFDLSCGNKVNKSWGNPVLEPNGWYTRDSTLISTLMESGVVKSAITGMKSAAVSVLDAFLNGGSFDQIADRASTSLKMNELVWGGKNEDRDDVRDWLNERLDWVGTN